VRCRAWIAEHIEGGLTTAGGISVEPKELDRIIDRIEADGLRLGWTFRVSTRTRTGQQSVARRDIGRGREQHG
jgi:hypothetical protein